MSLARRNPRNDNVRRRADKRPVAAQARPERQRPPHRHHRLSPAQRFFHRFQRRNHRRHKRDVVHHCRCRRRYAENDIHALFDASAGYPDEIVAHFFQKSAFVQRPDNDEQPHKKEHRRPVHAPQHVLHLFVALRMRQPHRIQKQHHRRPGQRDKPVFKPDVVRDHKRRHHHAQHPQRLFQKLKVGNCVFFVNIHHQRAVFERCRQAVFPKIDKHADHCRHNRQHHRRQMEQKIRKRKLQRRPDEDVRRVADKCCRTADIGCENIDKQVRIRVDLKLVGNLHRYRHNQQHRRYVVQKCRKHRRHKAHDNQDAQRVRAHFFRPPHCNVLKHAGSLRDIDDNHHSRQKRNRVKVNRRDCRLLRYRAAQHQPRPDQQRNHCPVQLFRKQKKVTQPHRRQRDRLVGKAENQVRRLHPSNPLKLISVLSPHPLVIRSFRHYSFAR